MFQRSHQMVSKQYNPPFENVFIQVYMYHNFLNPMKTSPEYTQAGVYGKCVL